MVFSRVVTSGLESSHYIRGGGKGAKNDPANYRPISLLPLFSKTFEKAMLSRLDNFLTSKDFFHDFQFGFRLKNSTEHACAVLLNYLHPALDSLLIPVALFPGCS